jgi:uncharacterized protein (TIGR03437 family)
MRCLFALVLLACAASAQDLPPAKNYGSLFFNFERNGKIPGPQTLSLGPDERRQLNILTVNASWLHVTQNNDGGPDLLTFTVDPTGLQPAIYEGSLLFTLGDAGLGTANIRLTVVDAPKFITIPTELKFSTDSPGPQTLYVTAANQPVAFTASASADAKWLSVSPAQAKTPSNLTVTVSPAGLVGGTYTGSILLSAAGAASFSVPVTFTVGGGLPQFTAANLLNLASLQTGSVAPGELIKITGINIPAESAVTPTASGFAVTALQDTRLLFDGNAIPLLAVSATEIRAMAPFELDGASSTQGQIEYKGQKGPAVTLKVAPAQPGIFTTDLTGKGQIVANQYNPSTQNFSQNTTGSGVEKGGTLSFFITGGGQLMPPGRTGSLRGGAGNLRLPVQATIGGKNADVIYAGAAPGLQEGVSQINILVPLDAPSGDAVALAVSINGVKSPDGPTAVVK